MKLLLLTFILLSCNVAKILTNGETDVDPDFFSSGCGASNDSTGDTGGNTNRFEGDTSTDGSNSDSCNHETLYDEIEAFYNFENSGDRGRDLSGKGLYLIDSSSAYSYLTGPNSTGALDCNAVSAAINIYSSNPSSNLNFGNSGNFTISFWLYNNGALAGGETIASFESSGTVFNISASAGGHLTLYMGGTEFSFPSGLGIIPWKHFAFVVDRNNGVKYYQNGIEVHSDGNSSSGISLTSDNILLCGKGPLGSVFDFWNMGGIDNLGVWSRTLNDSEVKSLYEGSNSLNK